MALWLESADTAHSKCAAARRPGASPGRATFCGAKRDSRDARWHTLCKTQRYMPTMPKQKPGRSKQTYGTPWDFIEAVKELLGIVEFDCDLAATAENAKCPNFITPEMDALDTSWATWGSGWNWLNPPFARIGPWVQRAWEYTVFDHTRTAVLVPAGVGANWWKAWVHRKADVYFLNGRLTFEGETLPYVKDCALLLYHAGFNHTPGYKVWDWRGRRVL